MTDLTENVANEKVQDYVKKSHIIEGNEPKSEKTTQDVQKKCLSLTKKWKNGELENGEYYCKHIESGRVVSATLMYGEELYCESITGTLNQGYWEVLAPVPSYEEWQAKESNEDFLQQRISVLESENTKLKAQIAKLTEIVGVLPSNHSIGNLGYKIKNQRCEINNRLKEIDKLQKLLGKCYRFLRLTETKVEAIEKVKRGLVKELDEVLK